MIYKWITIIIIKGDVYSVRILAIIQMHKKEVNNK